MIKSENYITSEIREAAEQEALASLMGTFTETMFGKVMANNKSNYLGWDVGSNEMINKLKMRLTDSINAGDWTDVANVSMFLWNLQQPDPPQEVK